MILVFSMAAVLWGIGAAMKAPMRQRWIMLGLLFLALIVIHLTLPADHPLRINTGGDLRLWVMLAAFAAIVFGYRAGLRRLKARHQQPDLIETPAAPDTLSEAELDRYARHIVLHDIGGTGQTRLKRAKVLVIGAGGLGSPVLIYLAASGVGTLGVVDDDTVDVSNLQRQVLHMDADLGRPKVESAVDNLYRLNPFVKVHAYHRRLEADTARDLVSGYDMVIDGSDNFATRQKVNAACVAAGIPLVSGALGTWDGTVSVFQGQGENPCYECAFPNPPAPRDDISCAEAGVFAPLPGIIGSLMAAEAVKLITNAGTPLFGRLLIHDVRESATRTIKVKRRADCPTCGGSS